MIKKMYNSAQVHPGESTSLLGLLREWECWVTNQDVGDPTAAALECLHPVKMIDGFPIATYVIDL